MQRFISGVCCFWSLNLINFNRSTCWFFFTNSFVILVFFKILVQRLTTQISWRLYCQNSLKNIFVFKITFSFEFALAKRTFTQTINCWIDITFLQLLSFFKQPWMFNLFLKWFWILWFRFTVFKFDSWKRRLNFHSDCTYIFKLRIIILNFFRFFSIYWVWILRGKAIYF